MTLGKYHNIDVLLWGKVGITVDKLFEQPDDVDAESQRTQLTEQWGIQWDEKNP